MPLAGWNFAPSSQRLERENARVVAIAEVDRIGVIAHGFHGRDSQRLSLGRGDDGKLQRRWRRGVAFFATGGAGAFVAQFADCVVADLAIAPGDAEAVGSAS